MFLNNLLVSIYMAEELRYHEGGGGRVLQTVDTCLRNYTISHPRRQWSAINIAYMRHFLSLEYHLRQNDIVFNFFISLLFYTAWSAFRYV
jgi:hypothetical protein